jgi:NADPH:quinone reductase-like Zn-dependent oxidoreductase
MAAIVQDRYGTEPETALRVDEVARPEVGPEEVLLRVDAVSLDRGTWHLMAGLPYPVRLAGFGVRAPKANPGRSVAGAVVEVGAEVTGLRVGDEVYGSAPGGLAEYVVADPARLAPRPAGLTAEQAAAVPISGLTAIQAVRDRGAVEAGQRVLVIGASGGVGSFAVQIAKAAGAEVTGVASTAKLDVVRSLGADHVVDYTTQDLGDAPHPFDVIIDTGGNRRVADLRRLLTPEGRLVIVGGETGGRWLGGVQRGVGAQILSLFSDQKLGTFISSEDRADLEALTELIEAGHVTPAVDRTFELADAAAAIRYLQDGHARGKVVVTCST